MNGKSDRPRSAEAAERLVKAGRLTEAIDEYEKLLDGTAQDIPIRGLIGDLCIQAGHPDRAARFLRTNIEALEAHGSFPQALALAKRVLKLDPDDAGLIVKLGDLYSRLGFPVEAKSEYTRAVDRLAEDNLKGRIALAEKLARLDRSDIEAKRRLAFLLARAGATDKAAAELNEAADVWLARGDAAEAERTLREALRLADGNVRSLANLARLLKKSRRMDEAVRMVEDCIRRRGPLADLVTLLGDLYLDARQDAKASEVYRRLLQDDPERADARAKLGILELRAGRPDEAYTLYEPLIASLLNHSREDRAVGLLGLILMSHPSHFASLDKVASIFRRGGRVEHLEAALWLLREEARRQGREEIRRRTVRELLDLRPDDAGLKKEWAAIRQEVPQAASTVPPPRAPSMPGKDREIVLSNLAKADGFLKQGLIRNARRVLENLRLLYPDDPRVQEKIESLPPDPPPASAEEMAARIGRLSEADAAPVSLPEDVVIGDTVSLDEIFAGTDLSPRPREEAGGGAYPDLTAKIREELEAIEAESFRQIKDRAAVIEKDINEIVAEFRHHVDRTIARSDYEARYHLGLAFLEQGLTDEAVTEFKMAAEDPARAVDCLALIAEAYRRRRDFAEALRWIDEALRRVEQGADVDYALTYERAEILADLGRNGEALRHFRRVESWNGTYRDIGARIKVLERITG